MFVETTLLSRAMSSGRTRPCSTTYCVSPANVTIRTPSTTRLPLGSTSVTSTAARAETLCELAHALDDEIAVGQHVGDEHRGARRDTLRIAHVSTPRIRGFSTDRQPRQLAVVLAKSGVDEPRDAVVDRRIAIGLFRLRALRDGGLGDDDGENVALRRRLPVGNHAAGRLGSGDP